MVEKPKIKPREWKAEIKDGILHVKAQRHVDNKGNITIIAPNLALINKTIKEHKNNGKRNI